MIELQVLTRFGHFRRDWHHVLNPGPPRKLLEALPLKKPLRDLPETSQRPPRDLPATSQRPVRPPRDHLLACLRASVLPCLLACLLASAKPPPKIEPTAMHDICRHFYMETNT